MRLDEILQFEPTPVADLAIRYSLMILVVANLIAAFHFTRAARTIRADLAQSR